MTYQQLLSLASSQEGRRLLTPTGRLFRVGIYMDGPYFIPVSTGLGRSDGRKAAERFLEIYNRTGSLRPSDYAKVTRNASYFIGLIAAGLEESASRPGTHEE